MFQSKKKKKKTNKQELLILSKYGQREIECGVEGFVSESQVSALFVKSF